MLSRKESANEVVEPCRNVLFLCTGNSARGIVAESVLNAAGKRRFQAFSAGSHPSGAVNPLVLATCAKTASAPKVPGSQSWDELASEAAPVMDFVITVCDQAAGEVCPIWPGRPVIPHWSAPDPAAYMTDPDKARQVVREVFHLMQWRISLFTSLPMEKLDRRALEARTRAIGARALTGGPAASLA